MDAYEALEFAPIAAEKVSHIATALGATKKRKVCGRLGGELLIVADYLRGLGAEQQDRLLRRVKKLLRDIEWVCSVSIRFIIVQGLRRIMADICGDPTACKLISELPTEQNTD
jgi:hypothetical protein